MTSMYGTYCRLRVHVMASDLAVIRKARQVIARKQRKAADKRKARHEFYRIILELHHSARRQYIHVQRGSV